jgi:DNA-binding FrmR family transcriptional regulator
MTGVFDKMAEGDTTKNQPLQDKPKVEKQDFKGVHAQYADMQHERAMNSGNKSSADEMLEKAAAGVNNMSMGGGGNNAQKDIEEAEKFSDEDLEHAQQLIFRGYAEIEVSLPRFPKNKFSICTINSEELSIIDEVVLARIAEAEEEDGSHSISDNALGIFRNNCYIALSYRGMNEKELCDDVLYQLNTLKKAIIKYNKMVLDGDLEKAKAFRKDLIKNIRKRVREVARMSNQILDFISNSRVDFDQKMARLMRSENIIPKS